MNTVLKLSALVLVLAAVQGRAQFTSSGGDDPTYRPDPDTVTSRTMRDEFPAPDPWSSLSSSGPSQFPYRITFFPPTTPLFGAPIADSSAAILLNRSRIVTPEMLADFVSDNFYPALGTRIVKNILSEKIPPRLEAYQARRTALINELTEQLHLVAGADLATSEQTLRAFAATQTPRIVALEKEAEQLRAELVNGGWLDGTTVDWNEIREWRLGALSPSNPAIAAAGEFQVIRAAAFFSHGFSPAQRGMLREIAMEQRDRLRTARRSAIPLPAGTTDPLAMFFSPETARVRLPAKLPADLSAKIGIYNHDKDELKAELRDTVVAQDQASVPTRTKYFTALADRQAARLASLDARAEEIRRGLAALPKPPLPANPPGLPPEFLDQLSAYRRDKRALDSEYFNRISQAGRMRVTVNPDQPIGERMRQIRVALRNAPQQAADDFRRENAGRYADLQQRSAKLRASLDTLVAGRTDPATGKPMDAATLMRQINAAEQQFEALGREEAIYHDYRVAMLLPGLSPAQRRLLFGAALVGLAQPLPPAEIINPRSPQMPY